MRRFSYLLIALFVLVPGSVWVSQRLVDTWEPNLRYTIAAAASKTLGIPVTVGRLAYHFPWGLTILQVEATPVLHVEAIVVGISPLNVPTALLRHKPLEAIGHLYFKNPQIRVTRDDVERLQHLIPHSKKATLNPPFFRVEVVDGLIELQNPQAPGHPWTLEQVNGVFQWRGPQQSLTIEARSPRIQRVELNYSAFGRRWRGSLSIEDLDLHRMLEHLSVLRGKPLIPKELEIDGHLDTQIHARARTVPHSFPEFLRAITQVRWQMSHGKVRLNGQEIPWVSHGHIIPSAHDFLIQDGILRTDELNWKLSGGISPYGKTPEMSFQAHATQVPLQPLLRLIHGSHAFEGTGDLIVRMYGPLNDLHTSIQTLCAQAELWAHPIREVSVLARYTNHMWELLDSGFKMAAGRLRAHGTIDGRELALKISMDQVPMDSLTHRPELGGQFSSAFDWTGPVDDWQLRGSWWISHLTWKAKNLTSDWRGDFEMAHEGEIKLNGETNDQTLHLQLRGNSDSTHLNVNQVVLEMPEAQNIRAQGDYFFSQKTATFTVVSDKLLWQGHTFENVNLVAMWADPVMNYKVTGHYHKDSDPDPAPALFSGLIRSWPEHIKVQKLHYQHQNIALDAQTEMQGTTAQHSFTGSATLHVAGKTSQSEFPITFNGFFDPTAEGHGQAHVVSGPAQADLTWDSLSTIAVKARLEKGDWNTWPLRLDLDGHWKPNDDSVFNLQGQIDPDGHLDAQFKLQARHLSINRAIFRTPESRLEFLPGGTVDFPAGGDLQTHLSAKLRNLHLGFLTFFGSLDLNGQWTRVKNHPVISAQARTHSLFINDYELETGEILARWEEGVLYFMAPEATPALITGNVNFQKRPQLTFNHLQVIGKESQKLDIDGEVGPTFWNYALQGQGLDLGILGELSGLSVPMSGVVDLKIVGKGDAQHPNVEGQARIQQGRIADVQYESGETDFIWQEDRITFQNLRLKDRGRYSALGGGVFPIRSKLNTAKPLPHIDFTVRLQDTNLGLLQSIFPEVKSARGDVEGLMQIQGTLDDPRFQGHLTINNGDVVGAHYFHHLKAIHVAVDFDHDRFRITDMRGRSGDGELVIKGDIGMSGFSPSDFNLNAQIPSHGNLEIEVPELAIPDSPLAKRFKFLTSVSHIDVSGQAQFTGSAEAPVFKGDVTLSNGHFTFPPSAKKSQSTTLTLWARHIFWDANLQFKDKAWFENELVEANVNGAFHIKGNAEALSVDGGLTIPQGKISYLGLQFDIREARFDMKAGAPFLSGQAESQVEATDTVGLSGGINTGQRFSVEDTITLTIPYGPLDQIKPRLTSAANPNLSQDKVLARVTQLDIENLTPEERTYLYQKQAVSLIDNSLTTPLAQKILKRTGIADRFRAEHVFDPSAAPPVDPVTGQATRSTTATDLFANTKYTVEKDLFGNLSIGYGVRFIPILSAETNQRTLDLVSDLQMSYRAFKNVYVRGNYDLPNSNSSIIPEKKVTIEPRWRFGWWGNTNPKKPQQK